MDEFDGYLTVQQAAERLAVCRQTIWRRIRAGDLTTYRTARNSRVRLLDITDIEAIERVTQERGRVRKDWSGKDSWDYLIESAANRAPEKMVDILDGEIWLEEEADTERHHARIGEGVSFEPTPTDADMGIMP